MKSSATAAVFLSLALGLGACGQSTPTPITLPGDSSSIGSGSVTVQGYLSNANGGPAVAGSSVTVTNAGGAVVGTGTTDAGGKFTLKVDPGAYNLDFAKAGYAGSRVESFPVTAGMTAPLNVVEKTAFDSTLPTAPPKITISAVFGNTQVPILDDPSAAPTFNASSGVTFRYVATSPDPVLSPYRLFADVGLTNTPGSPVLTSSFNVFNDPKNTTFDQIISFKGNSLRGVRGASYLNLVTYDLNYNRINKYVPINITDDAPITAPLGAFISSSARAVTTAQKYNGGGLSGAITTQGATAELSSMWVDLNFNYQTGLQGEITGYRVFTSSDGKAFRLLKNLPASATVARDSSPSLTPGTKVYYYIEAYNSAQSIASPIMDTTPLDSFTLTSIGPVTHSTGNSVKPTLSWSLDKQIGDYRKFFLNVMDYPSQGGYCVWGLVLCNDDTSDAANNTYLDDGSTPGLKVSGLNYSVPYNQNGKALIAKLDSYHSYTFDVSAAAYSKDGKAVSIAHDYFSYFFKGLTSCNFGTGAVCEGLLSTFTTGDGSN